MPIPPRLENADVVGALTPAGCCLADTTSPNLVPGYSAPFASETFTIHRLNLAGASGTNAAE